MLLYLIDSYGRVSCLIICINNWNLIKNCLIFVFLLGIIVKLFIV